MILFPENLITNWYVYGRNPHLKYHLQLKTNMVWRVVVWDFKAGVGEVIDMMIESKCLVIKCLLGFVETIQHRKE